MKIEFKKSETQPINFHWDEIINKPGLWKNVNDSSYRILVQYKKQFFLADHGLIDVVPIDHKWRLERWVRDESDTIIIHL